MINSINSMVESIPEALSIHINQIVADKKSRGEKVYTFSMGEAYFKIPKFEITDEEWFEGYHYSDSLGCLELREKLSSMYSTLYNVPTDPRTEIIVSAGSKICVYLVLMAITNKEDEILLPEPAWLSYKEQIKLLGGTVKHIPYSTNVFEYENFITNRSKAIIINNPNNPSGRLYSSDELQFLLDLAKKNNLYVISDEAYSDFIPMNEEFISIGNIDVNKDNSIIVNSISKNMGLSGWRIGYIIANSKIIKNLLKINQHLITCAPTCLQNYISKNFEYLSNITRPQARMLAEKRKSVDELLSKYGLTALPGVGTFYYLIDTSSFNGTTDELVCTLLEKFNVATVPGQAYGISTNKFIRFGIGIENLTNIEYGLKVISELLRS